MNKNLLFLIVSTLLLFGCSNTLMVEFATVKAINEDSVIIETWGGKTTEVTIPYTDDVKLEVNKEYFFNYEDTRSGKNVFISAEE